MEPRALLALTVLAGAGWDADALALLSLCRATRGCEALWRALLPADERRSARTRLMHAAHRNDTERLNFLCLSARADMSRRSAAKGGRAALHFAAALGHVPAARALLELGAEVDVRDAAGRTPLMLAARSGFVDIVVLLCDEGRAVVNAATVAGDTALAIAVRADRAQASSALLRFGADPGLHPRNRFSPLTDACRHTRPDCARVLAGYAIDAACADGGQTNLMALAQENKHEHLAALLPWSRAQMRCLQIDAQDAHGRTALALAAACGALGAVVELVSWGARVNLVDATGLTALAHARNNGHHRAVDFLRSCGARSGAEEDECEDDIDGDDFALPPALGIVEDEDEDEEEDEFEEDDGGDFGWEEYQQPNAN
jgi:ankyrin repeat protein